jgi:hypothetical protein
MPNTSLLSVLANALMAGEQDVASIASRVQQALDPRVMGKRGLAGIARRYAETFTSKARPTRWQVEQFLFYDPGFLRLQSAARKQPPILNWLSGPDRMLPMPAAKTWDLPPIVSVGELATWLRLDPDDLNWFADAKKLNRRATEPALHHYYYKLVPKRSGEFRLIEAPKQHLKLLQRQILSEILNRIPPHPAAHGFIPGRSIRTFTAPHVGQPVVLRLDIRDFFPSISRTRIEAFFRTAGYPDAVSVALAAICTNAAPGAIWREHRTQTGVEEGYHLRQLYSASHLPQGAPTSPALANFCAHRIDCRLAGLAKAAGAQYTRYADDLAFSGDEAFARHAASFADHVAAILLEEGFSAHHRKTRILRQGVRQHLAGLVVNQHPNLARDDYDRLKAILTNCVRQGPQAQNREAHPDFRAHLAGRVGWVASVNPARGAKLRQLLDQIVW